MDINEAKNFCIVMSFLCFIVTSITFYNFTKNTNLLRTQLNDDDIFIQKQLKEDIFYYQKQLNDDNIFIQKQLNNND